MFEELEKIDWKDCSRTYTRVEAQIASLTSDVGQRSAIYQVLWDHGGRCDCTTAFNIVKRSEVRSDVERAINDIVKAS
jgi:hypothetical protein